MRSENNNSTRRGFINWFMGLSIAGLFTSVAYPVFRFLSPPDIPEAATSEVEVGMINDPELIAAADRLALATFCLTCSRRISE